MDTFIVLYFVCLFVCFSFVFWKNRNNECKISRLQTTISDRLRMRPGTEHDRLHVTSLLSPLLSQLSSLVVSCSRVESK